MKRREFIASSFAYASCVPRVCAGQGKRHSTIAFVHPSAPTSMMMKESAGKYAILLNYLEKSGFSEGDNLNIERYSANGSTDKLRDVVKAAVAGKPDVIFANSGKTVVEIRRLTDTIPIVGIMSDPVAYGLVSSLSHPGGNVTGVVVDAGIEIWVKRLAILKEAVPSMSKVFYVAPDTTWSTAVGIEVQAAAKQLGLELLGPPVATPHQEEEYRKSFAKAVHVDAAIISSAPENYSEMKSIIRFIDNLKLPAIYPYREYVVAGGLMAYDINLDDLWSKAALQIVEILRGDKAGDLPVYQPTRFRFIINEAAAKTISFEFSPALVARADEVID